MVIMVLAFGGVGGEGPRQWEAGGRVEVERPDFVAREVRGEMRFVGEGDAEERGAGERH